VALLAAGDEQWSDVAFEVLGRLAVRFGSDRTAQAGAEHSEEQQACPGGVPAQFDLRNRGHGEAFAARWAAG
jgi:hypothetical protein